MCYGSFCSRKSLWNAAVTEDFDRSLGGEQTAGDLVKRRASTAEVSLGDVRTLGDGRSVQDTVIDDIEVVDLEARYRVEGTLGQGGMGAVLLATDTRLDRKVAIKRILGEAAGNRMAVQRFLTEAKAIAALNHPNIVQIYDYGRAKDGPFLIMEFVDGGSLLDRCRESALPLDEAIDLACHLCDGLAKAHDLGIIHRDIKPANVLISKDGIPKLTDFGLAKAQASDHGQTMTGAVLGTPDFMPPEQRRDASLVDHRSDLWSLAATIYQMVTGRSPKIIRFDLLPPGLTSVLGKALEDAKDARYQTARELRDALKTSLRAVVLEPQVIQGKCPACGVQNESSRRFCRGCGESLEAPCLSCTKPMPMWEEICGQCGTKQAPLVDERRQSMAAKQAEAEGALGDFEFDRAAGIATELRDQSHPRLKHLAVWATSFVDTIEKSRAEQTRQAVEMMKEAGKHEAAYDYLSARVAIESIPESLQAEILPGMRETAAAMLERAKQKQSESRRLEGIVKERLAAKRLDELLPDVERLLVLHPDRADVQKIRGQLLERRTRHEAARDEAMAAAEASLLTHDYTKAQAMLQSIAAAAVTPDVVQLRARVESLVQQVQGLSKRIREAVAGKALDGLLPTVEEYLALKPEDAQAQSLRQSLEQREEKLAADIAGRLAHAKSLLAVCAFDKAVKVLTAIPESRLSPEAQGMLDRAMRLASLRAPAVTALVGAGAGGYSAALEASEEYRLAISLADISDAEYGNLVAKAEAALEQERRARRTLLITMATATGMLLVMMLVGVGWWVRSTQRAGSLASALAQGRWEAALSIDPQNSQALVGRARARLSANPVDTAGAFVDLDQAEGQPGAAAILKTVRAEAHALRAQEHAKAGRLDTAAEDLLKAKALSAPAEAVSRAEAAIAQGWLGLGSEGVAKGDARAIRRAADAALAAGGDRESVLGIWEEYVKGRIEKLDAKGLGEACVEAKKAGLSAKEEAGWWIRFGEMAAAPPHEKAAEVIRAADAALAVGAQESAVAPLRARGLVLEAVEFQTKGNVKGAVTGMLAASLLDAAHVKEVLNQAKNVPLREGVMAEYRGRFDAALSAKDWPEVLRVAAAAKTVGRASASWVTEAVAELPPAALASLPPAALASLPPAVISAIPPLTNSIGMKFKLLPAGTFTMGFKSSDETPHDVTLSRPFYLGVYEVTNAQWMRVMGSVPSNWKDGNRPVEQVRWEEAMEFCQRLSTLPEEEKAGRGYRLPTEAEWEYACRAGTQTTYSFGDDEGRLREYGWFDEDAVKGETHPVGLKKPNGWGLYDMHGNVWEWCSDWYDKYPPNAVTDPQGPPHGSQRPSQRVFRGGSWNSDASRCQSAGRNYYDSAYLRTLGFRLALSPSEAQPVPLEADK